MSSTSNSQNLLVNVFRPTYVYSAGTGYVPKLVLSNIDLLTATQIVTDNFQFGGVSGNVYIGSNVGGGSNNSNNVAVGVNAMASGSNTQGTIAIGYSALQVVNSACNSVAIGTETTGGGVSNVIVGARSGASGSNVIVLGPGLDAGGVSNKLYIGAGALSNTVLYADLATKQVGINTQTPAEESSLDVSGNARISKWLAVGFDTARAAVDANGYVYSTLGFAAQGGSATNPAFTFIDDSGTGFYQTGLGGFAITAQGQRRMDISGDTIYVYGNLKAFGSVNIGSIDTSSFAFGDGFVRDNATTPLTDISRTGIRTALVEAETIFQTSNGMIRVGPSASPTVDISGSSLRAANVFATAAVQTPFVHDAGGTYDMSGGNLRLSSNLVVSNVLRTPAGAFRVGAISAPLTDISGGNIRTLGTVDLSTGTAIRPSLTFVTDPSSGLHSGGTSSLAFATAGVQRMTLSNGNLGIGTATPVVKLEVVGDVSATTYNGPGGTQSAPHYTFSDDRTTGLFFPGANIVGFTAGGTERMRISNGTIGIGTTAPTSALEISGGALRITSGTGGAIVLSNGQIDISGTTVVSSSGVFSNAATTSNSIGGVALLSNVLRTGDGSAAIPAHSFASDASLGLYRLGADQLGVTAAGVTRLVISNSNVGIGRTDPTNTLDISGSLRISNGPLTITRPATAEGQNHILFRSSNDGARFTMTLGPAETGSGNGGANLNFNTFTDAGASLVPNALVIHRSNGNIGLATAAPDARLHVSGGAIVSTFLRNALTPTQFDISGGNLSNSATTRSSNFVTTSASSNSIGGVTLNASNITAGTGSNSIGGVTLNASNITAGTGSNSIGGVILSNGLVRTAAGSVSAPVYTFSNATTSGLWASNSNDLRVALTGSERIRFTAGTSTSGSDTSKTTLALFGYGVNVGGIPSDQVINEILFRNGAEPYTSAIRQIQSNGALVDGNRIGIFTSPGGGLGDVLVERLSVLRNGNVGIGTTNPGSLFTVAGNVSYSGSITGTNGNTSNSIGGVTLNASNITAGTGSNSIGGVILSNEIVRAGAGTSNAPTYTFSNAPTSGLWANSSNEIRMSLNGTRRFRFGARSAFGGGSDVSNTVLALWGTGVGGTTVDLCINEITFRNGNEAHVCAIRQIQPKGFNVDKNRLGFFTIFGSGDSNPQERMSITYDGKIGIGTVDPRYTLDVSGTMSAGSNEYTVYIDTSQTLAVPAGFTKAHITLVGGGGAGGSNSSSGIVRGGGGGGGAGWRVEQYVTDPSAFTIVIGKGGSGNPTPTNGSNSTITYDGLQSGTIVAPGGTAGASALGSNGGVGGSGYYGGGGGGAATGATLGSGGTGTILSGSAGGVGTSTTGGAGGSGGGAANGRAGSTNYSSGGGGGGPCGGTPTDGIGGSGGPGCGGAGGTSSRGGDGGNGYCIIRFLK